MNSRTLHVICILKNSNLWHASSLFSRIFFNSPVWYYTSAERNNSHFGCVSFLLYCACVSVPCSCYSRLEFWLLTPWYRSADAGLLYPIYIHSAVEFAAVCSTPHPLPAIIRSSPIPWVVSVLLIFIYKTTYLLFFESF
jgi:hypothetical protein